MIENRPGTLAQFISPFEGKKILSTVRVNGKDLRVSGGMAESGYDITLLDAVTLYGGYSVLGVTAETVVMPDNMAARVLGKSTWARLGIHLNVTEIDPGFGTAREGGCHVTLELSYMPRWRGLLNHWWHILWPERLTIPAGTGIGCLQFVYTSRPVKYEGKYENQPAKPVEAL